MTSGDQEILISLDHDSQGFTIARAGDNVAIAFQETDAYQMAIPHEPHFFKPLLPGFHSGVTIPLAFFSKHIEGKMNQKTWKLRSDASDQTWEVILEGRTLTGGWKDFTTAHDLQIGDLVIFKHEGDMVFHVTPFGPSCCEIQYTHPHIIKEEADSGDADDNEIRGTVAMSSFSYDFCFLAEVTASNLKADKLYLPKRATSSTALNKQCQEMILVNKEGNSWTASLRFSKSGGMYYITRGWGKFCRDNRCDIGDLFVFNLVGDGKTTPLLCVCPESKECSELLSKHLSRKRGDIASSSRVN
ncbi:B3 domain-containing protein REM7-like [Brassica napus]|uniref:B3 domain-containing protein REM7-like n=1 Tax=Brassica napus TaxID=3708 RepID=UPI00207916EF|nr:B3 domain-containing protein REM7-like [Brassica napus]